MYQKQCDFTEKVIGVAYICKCLIIVRLMGTPHFFTACGTEFYEHA